MNSVLFFSFLVMKGGTRKPNDDVKSERSQLIEVES